MRGITTVTNMLCRLMTEEDSAIVHKLGHCAFMAWLIECRDGTDNDAMRSRERYKAARGLSIRAQVIQDMVAARELLLTTVPHLPQRALSSNDWRRDWR